MDVLPYLTDVLRRLPAVAADDKAGIDEFLPDRWLAAHPQHRLVHANANPGRPKTDGKIAAPPGELPVMHRPPATPSDAVPLTVTLLGKVAIRATAANPVAVAEIH